MIDCCHRFSVRRALAALLGFPLLLAVSMPAAHAQSDWPARPIRIVVPFAPGGTTDITARIIAEQLTSALKQTVVVENKAGAGGNVGAAEVARPAPDGYTFLMGTPGTQAINQFLYPRMPYDTAKVFLTHIPYRGSLPMLQDLMAGQIQMSIDNLPSALPYIKSGKLRALGVTSLNRSEQLPDVPTVASVLPGFSAESWFVLVAPAGTPRAIIERLSGEVDRIVKKKDVSDRFKALGAEPVGGTPELLGKFIADETRKWQQVVKASGAKID